MFFLSCNENANLINIEPENNEFSDQSANQLLNNSLKTRADYFISEEQAILVAKNHFVSMEYEKTNRIPEEKRISKITLINDSLSNETLIYVLEYDRGGFCLVSGDRRFDPILAYSETNSWGGNDLKGPNNFLAAYKNEIRKLQKENKKSTGVIESAWSRLKYYSAHKGQSKRGNSSQDAKSSSCGVYGECLPIYCEYSYSVNVGPLTDPIAMWRQGGSFSFYSPSDNNCECDRKLAGCGPIALAMLLRYHESPLMNMTFNGASAYTDYQNMPKYAGSCTNNSGGYKSSAMLIALCGSAMNSNYGVLGNCNTSTHPNKIGDGLDWFGYSHDGKGDLDDRYNAVNNDLKFGYPVILTGSEYSWHPWDNWHIWLADGINEQYSESWSDNGSCQDIWNGASPASCGVCPDCVDCFIYQTTEWHMNWGWDGISNGWYNASHTTIGAYSHYMRAYTKIRP